MVQTGKMTQTGFETINNAKQNGKWETAYSCKVTPIIPKDLENALKENKLALKNFNKFSNSTKLQYIYWIENAKKDYIQQKRIINVVKKGTRNIKPL